MPNLSSILPPNNIVTSENEATLTNKTLTDPIIQYIAGDTSFTVPSGTTAERPSSPETGELRFNTDEGSLEQYDGTNWGAVVPDDIDLNTLSINGTQVVDSSGNIDTGSVSINGTLLTNGESIRVPSGTTVERPASPVTGELRFNTDEGSFEKYDGTEWTTLAPPIEKGSLDKTFAAGESASIALSEPVSGAPVVSVIKEVPQTGVTSNDWDVATNGENYDRHDTAAATTLTPSNATGDGTFTLGTGSFASTDVGKTIEGNGGEAILTATDGSYSLVTAFNDTSAIASGDWSMFATVFDATNGLELSGLTEGFDIASASYDSVSIDVSAQIGNDFSVTFKPDGSIMYLLDSGNDDVFQYSLSTPYNLNTASYASKSFVASQDTEMQDLHFKPDGTKMFLAGGGSDSVYQYTLSTAWI